MHNCPRFYRMRRKKRLRTILISLLDRLISCLECCQGMSLGTWKVWLLSLVALVILCTAVWRVFLYDLCDTAMIKQKLCEQYAEGQIAGDLCYPLCVEDTNVFTYCQEEGHQKSFLWYKTVFKVHSVDESQSSWSVNEGIKLAAFQRQVNTFLQQRFGHSINSDLSDMLVSFADFNKDGKLSLGEAQSVWRLIHIDEFLLLFTFRESSVIPNLNSTCGSLYGYQYTPIPRLYNKQSNSWLSRIFSNSYKWEFPRWPRRARTSLGLVEFAMDLYEEQGIKFRMCDVSPTKFGMMLTYEAKVTSLKEIQSEDSVRRTLQNRTCFSDSHCKYLQHCASKCDMSMGRCSGEITHPTLMYMCEIIEDYLLFDTPMHLYYELKRLLDRCSKLSTEHTVADLEHAVVFHDLKAFLWREIQYNSYS